MARNTLYTLYATGRTDPTFSNVWAFSTATERETFLNGKSPLNFENNKYWRVGNTIKCAVDYESSFKYDYARIINKAATQEARTYFCFITGRIYISPNVTMFVLDVDYLQTYYFVNNIPFWNCSAFITKGTRKEQRLRGTTSEFPVPVVEAQANSVKYFSNDYAYVIYSTVNIPSLLAGSTEYTTYYGSGVLLAAAPYIGWFGTTQAGSQAVNEIVLAFNNAGLTDAITGIYIIPLDLVNTDVLASGAFRVFDNSYLQEFAYVYNKPTSCGEYTPINKELLGYDYSYVVVSNGQGETQAFHFEDFYGEQISLNFSVSLLAGYPTINMRPVGYIYGDDNAFRLHVQKITTPVSCSYLNDSFRIWLAQTQNSRAAQINAAQLAIDNAEEARAAHAYQVQGYNFLDSNAPNTNNLSLLSKVTQNISDRASEIADRQLLNTNSSNPIVKGVYAGAEAVTDAVLRTGSAVAGLYSKAERAVNQGIANSPIGDVYNSLANIGNQLLKKFLNVENAYMYDQNVANAQASMDVLLASYRDKARIPATATGSNAYGDLVFFQQYGFIACVMQPSSEWAEIIDKNITATGHPVSMYLTIARQHQVFDYVQALSPKISVDVNNRPQYVRNMMIQILMNGVYLWYVNNNDISEWIGSPYNLTNPEV